MDGDFSLDNTIFAWATAADPAARTILRISGPAAFPVLAAGFVPDEPDRAIARGTSAGFLRLNEDLRVRCRVWRFPGPGSFTGQDLAEIHVPGNPSLMRLIDRQMLEMGLTPARAGEFTARGFLLGKMDLTQAQAVKELVEARNDAQVQAALNLLHGRFHQWLMDVYRELSDLTVALELNLDFSEEQIEAITLDEVEQRLSALRATIDDLLRRAIDSQAISAAPRVFLVGPTNAGKSTLLNRLTGLDRAICSPLPETTRDILTAVWQYDEREVLLCDTPGLTEQPSDAITQQALDRAAQFLPLADLTVLVFDADQPIEPQLQLVGARLVDKSKAVAVLNKADRFDAAALHRSLAAVHRFLDHRDGAVFAVSAVTGANLAELTVEVFLRLSDAAVTTGGQQVVLDLRGREILEAVRVCLDQARNDARVLREHETLLGLETVAATVQQALRTVGRMLGKDVTEDVLETIFSRFCIGK